TELSTVLKKVSRFYGHGSTTIPTPILVAATRAFREQSAGGLLDTYLSVGSSDAVDVASPQMKFIETLQKGRDFVWKRLNEIPHISCEKPQTALYAFPRLDLIGSVWKSDREFILDFLEA